MTINWWHVATKLNLAERFAMFPKTIFYGKIYEVGIQKLAYGKVAKDFVIFDTFDLSAGSYNDWDKIVAIAQQVGLPIVPVLYRGPWKGEELWLLAEGESTIAGHVREGFVVKPLKERWDGLIGRVILKLVGEGYNLSK